ncbi:hypothetical protein N7491_006235 [Penicillium cf. griseofulvum]|uniref:Uncharacterized protein n=1 Tax=Penicillium cf. griseofulvum TaxID=2972120 RepID=A0A9W9IVM3_9EURO|nr:hypothetical protein N7472_010734 [Penicillium cf. griseofulvum]KAJ5429219.1 hypothetical protein N7491_006235 [Penicillium cf. griseofulvum]KAJ5436989.1 hypothetical protein N7445_007874 [Penicillium cf. griseofulvum]
MAEQRWKRFCQAGHATRAVKLTPRIRKPSDFVGDELPSQNTVRSNIWPFHAQSTNLVLSEFTGAAVFMKHGSLLFKPANAEGLSNALYEAVTMEKKDRKKMYEELREFVTTNTSAEWTETFLGELKK